MEDMSRRPARAMFSVRGMGVAERVSASTLLLVHNEQAQILELDVLLQKPVRADDYVGGAVPYRLQRLFYFGRRAEAAEHLYPDGIAGKAPCRGHVMLLGEHGRRHEYGRLLAVHDAFHDGAEGDLGLAEANVAAKQPVHGDGPFHIRLYFGYSPKLVLSFGIFEAVFKFLLPDGVGGEGVARPPRPLRVELDQALGELLRRAPGAGFGPAPFGAAELAEADGGVLPRGSDILGNHVELRHGDIEAVGARIGDFYIILFHPVHGQPEDADETAYAVVFVHDKIALAQVREALEPAPV